MSDKARLQTAPNWSLIHCIMNPFILTPFILTHMPSALRIACKEAVIANSKIVIVSMYWDSDATMQNATAVIAVILSTLVLCRSSAPGSSLWKEDDTLCLNHLLDDTAD